MIFSEICASFTWCPPPCFLPAKHLSVLSVEPKWVLGEVLLQDFLSTRNSPNIEILTMQTLMCTCKLVTCGSWGVSNKIIDDGLQHKLSFFHF